MVQPIEVRPRQRLVEHAERVKTAPPLDEGAQNRKTWIDGAAE